MKKLHVLAQQTTSLRLCASVLTQASCEQEQPILAMQLPACAQDAAR
jgi:hypothetical protein